MESVRRNRLAPLLLSECFLRNAATILHLLLRHEIFGIVLYDTSPPVRASSPRFSSSRALSKGPDRINHLKTLADKTIQNLALGDPPNLVLIRKLKYVRRSRPSQRRHKPRPSAAFSNRETSAVPIINYCLVPPCAPLPTAKVSFPAPRKTVSARAHSHAPFTYASRTNRKRSPNPSFATRK